MKEHGELTCTPAAQHTAYQFASLIPKQSYDMQSQAGSSRTTATAAQQHTSLADCDCDGLHNHISVTF